jgi:putative transposase
LGSLRNMPNSPRFNLPGFPQHIVQRGNDHRRCFLLEDDFREYLGRLLAASRKYAVAIHAYALMPNHVHLLATPACMEGIGRVMQAVGSGYVRRFNSRHERSGTLWDRRYFSALVGNDAYLWHCHRYIELNPVRAGIASHPGDYPWSSYARNAFGRHDDLVTPHPAIAGLGPAGSAERAYWAMIDTGLDESTLQEIRQSLHAERAFGDEAFLARIESLTERSPRQLSRGRPRSDAQKIISDLFNSKA